MDIHEFSWISMTSYLNAIRRILSVRAVCAHAREQRSEGNEIIALAQAAAAVRGDRRSRYFIVLGIFTI
jgi:hypothetical protein